MLNVSGASCPMLYVGKAQSVSCISKLTKHLPRLVIQNFAQAFFPIYLKPVLR